MIRSRSLQCAAGAAPVADGEPRLAGPKQRGGVQAAAFIAALALSLTQATAQTPPAPAPQQQPQQPQQRLTIGVVDIENDPRYEPIRGYERLILKTRDHPYAGAQVGIAEAQALTRVLRTDFALERITVKS